MLLKSMTIVYNSIKGISLWRIAPLFKFNFSLYIFMKNHILTNLMFFLNPFYLMYMYVIIILAGKLSFFF